MKEYENRKIIFLNDFFSTVLIQQSEIDVVELEDSLLSHFYIRKNEQKYNLVENKILSFSTLFISSFLFLNSPVFAKNSKDFQTISKKEPNKGKGQKVGGVLTGYSFYRYMELCNLWLEKYKQENPLLEIDEKALKKARLSQDFNPDLEQVSLGNFKFEKF